MPRRANANRTVDVGGQMTRSLRSQPSHGTQSKESKEGDPAYAPCSTRDHHRDAAMVSKRCDVQMRAPFGAQRDAGNGLITIRSSSVIY
jgi:hypothetical protein